MNVMRNRRVQIKSQPHEIGLNEEQVATSRAKYGANRLSHKKERGFFSRFLESFGDPMIKILLIALGVNVIFLFNYSDWYETAGIAVAVLLATVISTLSEQGSESAFKRLQEEASRTNCRVIRFEGMTEMPTDEVVVGDLISLQAGDRVPADGFLLHGGVDVDQSSLNGETKEANKLPLTGNLPAMSGDLLDKHQLFSGTVVCAGQGVMRVAAVGDSTFYGRLAQEVQEEKGESPLKQRLAGLAKTISKFGYMGAALVSLAYLINVLLLDNGLDPQRIAQTLTNPGVLFAHLLQALTLAVTVIVVAVPEGLPMMITVVLSSNMKRMLKDNVLVRKLVGIETAGSMNILFTDKTGTLTKGKFEVTGCIDASGKLWSSADKLAQQPLWEYVHHSIYFNTLSTMSEGRAIGGNLTDRALLEYVSRNPVRHDQIWRAAVIPFDSRAKFMATQVTGALSVTLIKGAPEVILPHCTECMDADGRRQPFFSKTAIEKVISALQKESARVIALAISDHTVTSAGDFKQLRLVGLIAVRDEVRPEAIQGVKQIQNAGIHVVMITGDAKATAEAIARQTGLLSQTHPTVLTSDELGKMSDDQISDILPKICVVARALPTDKSRLVRIAQGKGLVTGMTGDGVNDAPALKRADIGFAMGSGTEVAREAGDIVILDDNLLSIAKAVRYGRTIFKSIRKFIIFQLTVNFCAMGVSMIAPLIGVDTPVTVLQMLWINMVMDTLAGLAFGGEPARLEYMREAPKQRDESILNSYMWKEIVLGSMYGILMCLWFIKSPYVAKLFGPQGSIHFYTGFFALFMFTGLFNSVCARTHRMNLLDSIAGNKPFVLIMGIVTLVQVGLLYFGGSVFRTAPLSVNQFLFVVLLASTTVLMHLIRKAWYQSRGILTGT